MNHEELAKYRVLAELCRRLRRENEALKAENQALKAGLAADTRDFDEENRGLFEMVHRNNRIRAPFEETFYYGT